MRNLVEFVQRHVNVVPVDHPDYETLDSKTSADLVFFKVTAKDDPDAEELKKLIKENVQGEFCDLNPLEGEEYSYLQVGGWIGDQGRALQLMGLGSILGVWGLMTPKMLKIPEDLVQQMAGMGYVSIIPKKN